MSEVPLYALDVVEHGWGMLFSHGSFLMSEVPLIHQFVLQGYLAHKKQPPPRGAP